MTPVLVTPESAVGINSMCDNATEDNSSDGVECPTCGDEYASRKGVGQHHKKTHGESLRAYERRQEDGVECPTCGRSDFDTERGMKLHHGRMHGESLSKETRECAWCGDDVRVLPTRRGKNDRVFCSDSDCYPKWQSENRTGENAPTWNGGFSETECVVCGKEKKVRPQHIEAFDVHFCSTECESEYKTGRLIGKNHPAWEGGYRDYGPGWNDAKKEAVRERDNYTCQHPGCTVTNDQHTELYGMSLHVHHIQNHRQFDSAEERNAMSNLVALCISHHNLWEQMSPLTPSNYAD